MSVILPDDDFEEYLKLRKVGVTASNMYLIGKENGLDEIALLRMLRHVYRLSLRDAKEAMLVANGAPSLEAHEQSLAESVTDFLNEGGPERVD